MSVGGAKPTQTEKLGQRRTKQREAILRAIQKTRSHPDAHWVYEEVRQELPHISLGTVYRNLDLLMSTGAITQIKTPGATSRYDGNLESHSHLSCRSCGRIVDVEPKAEIDLNQPALLASGFGGIEFRVEFFGYCPDCKTN